MKLFNYVEWEIVDFPSKELFDKYVMEQMNIYRLNGYDVELKKHTEKSYIIDYKKKDESSYAFMLK